VVLGCGVSVGDVRLVEQAEIRNARAMIDKNISKMFLINVLLHVSIGLEV
jgi:hypothetical protein